MTFSPGLATAILLGIGMIWGLTIPLTKIAVSTGYSPIGLITAEMCIGAAILLLVNGFRRRLQPPSGGHLVLFLVVALLGTVIPNYFSFIAIRHVPAGIMALTIAMVPIFAMPIALVVGQERFEARRFLGVILGAISVILLVGPESSLPDPAQAVFVLIALIAPFCYGCEGNYLAWRGTQGLDALQVLMGAMCVAIVGLVPLSLSTGQWIDPMVVWGPAEFAIVAVAVLHVVAYATYVWLVGVAGPVFSSQVAYVVTGSGVIWSMLLLSENYSLWIWAALILILLAITLVRPNPAKG